MLNIIRKKPVSRAELARLTGLTRAAITLIVDELIQEGVLEEIGIAETGMGRSQYTDLDIEIILLLVCIFHEECCINVRILRLNLL